MIFEKIILNNMFSYCGEVVFDLAGKTDQKNIVLISGRNGFGKTSFLNAIKLLFTGVTDDLRSEVRRQRKPSPKQYVVGSGDDWWGIFNRHAKADSSAFCSVEIIWRENGEQITARREWTVRNDNYDEQFTIQLYDKTLNNEEAKSFLDERLPDDYVPFFFFDGEKMQELVSANIAQLAEHIERLLNISHVNNLRMALKAAIADWQSEGALDQAAEAELEKTKNEDHILEKEIEAEIQKEKDLQYNLENLEEEIEILQNRMESFRSFISKQNEAGVQRRISELKKKKEKLLIEIGEELPHDIIFLANQQLINKVHDELNNYLSGNKIQETSLKDQLIEFLADDIFDRPPFPNTPISDDHKQFYKTKLLRKIQEYTGRQNSASGDSLFTLNISDANVLQECIQPYINSYPLRIEKKKVFSELQSVKNELYQRRVELLNISGLSVEEKHAYESLKKELREKNKERDEIRDNLSAIKHKKNELLRKKEGLKMEIKRKERELQLSKAARKKINKAKEIQVFFNSYKDRLKKRRRVELEESINLYFKKIMTSNELIQHIAIDDNFGIHFQDKDGSLIGMSSLSAGMKQLAATSLLWALKTCSGRPMPIIVDTPMARIDKGNQENLLRHYYPAVGEQVILLPTDSELDERKYNLLKPYIYQEYVLENKIGSKSRPVKKTMYPV